MCFVAMDKRCAWNLGAVRMPYFYDSNADGNCLFSSHLKIRNRNCPAPLFRFTWCFPPPPEIGNRGPFQSCICFFIHLTWLVSRLKSFSLLLGPCSTHCTAQGEGEDFQLNSGLAVGCREAQESRMLLPVIWTRNYGYFRALYIIDLGALGPLVVLRRHEQATETKEQQWRE